MLKAVFFAALAGLALLSAPAMAEDAEAHYQALLTAAKAGTAPVDWQALRFAYADRPTYDLEAGRDDRAAMFKAFNANDWAGTVAAANRVLGVNYCSAMTHLVVGIADDRLGQAADAQREKAIARGLFESIRTGDGLSHEHAFTVISVGEEYDFFIFAGVDLHNNKYTQRLDQQGGHSYDVFDVTDGTGKTVTYYFNIDRAWAAETRALHGK